MQKHLEALDGLRGVAAISVLLYHLGHWLNAPWLATNSSLCVDLFFCLSGYVLPHAYWSKRDTISNFDFFRLRAIRLFPLIILGAVISLVYVCLKVRTAHLSVSPGAIALAAAGAVFDIPTVGAPHEIGGPMVFPLNGPQFTLFLEFVANLIWWFLRKRVSRILIGIMVITSAIVLYKFGISGDTQNTFWLGFPRVAFSFALGLIVFHTQDVYKPKYSINALVFILAALVSLSVFYCPFRLPIWVELAWIAVVSPTLVASGSRLALKGGVRRASLWLGALSYPIYALHYPIFCWVNGIYRSRFAAHNLLVEAPLVAGVVLAGSYAALIIYDQPARRWLTDKIGGRRRSLAAQDSAPSPIVN